MRFMCSFGFHTLAVFLCHQCQRAVCRLHSEECCGVRFCDDCINKHRVSAVQRQLKENVNGKELE